MPKTCTNSSQHKHKRQRICKINGLCPPPPPNTWSSTQYHQLIPRMQYTVNEEHLRKQCAQSIENIRVLFDIPAANSVLQSLQHLAIDPRASHTTLLALFFRAISFPTRWVAGRSSRCRCTQTKSKYSPTPSCTSSTSCSASLKGPMFLLHCPLLPGMLLLHCPSSSTPPCKHEFIPKRS